MDTSNDIEKRFRSLIHRHEWLLWLLCYRYAQGYYSRARELYQEVLCAVWCRLQQLEADADTLRERQWLRLQARNVMSHRHRQRQLIVPLDERLGNSLVDEEAEQQRRNNELLDELAAHLSDEDRQLVRLYRDGFRPDEMAQILSISTEAVYQRLHRTVQRMKTIHEQINSRKI